MNDFILIALMPVWCYIGFKMGVRKNIPKNIGTLLIDTSDNSIFLEINKNCTDALDTAKFITLDVDRVRSKNMPYNEEK